MRTVEITWRGTRPVTAAELAEDRAHADARGYPVHIWGDVNLSQELVILMRVITDHGDTVALYETSYTEETE